jgi:glycosyltransferase involved in cell wall biosynthesis
MASGAPVVASNAGGLPEVIEDGETGFMLPVGDIDGMAAAGVRILCDDALRKRMSAAGRGLAEERFSIGKIVPRYEALYERVLAQ